MSTGTRCSCDIWYYSFMLALVPGSWDPTTCFVASIFAVSYCSSCWLGYLHPSFVVGSVHHLTAVIGLGCLAWAGHLVHVSIPTDAGVGFTPSAPYTTGRTWTAIGGTGTRTSFCSVRIAGSMMFYELSAFDPTQVSTFGIDANIPIYLKAPAYQVGLTLSRDFLIEEGYLKAFGSCGRSRGW
jgi:hypothetical protein